MLIKCLSKKGFNSFTVGQIYEVFDSERSIKYIISDHGNKIFIVKNTNNEYESHSACFSKLSIDQERSIKINKILE